MIINALKSILMAFLYAGCKKHNNEEENQKVFILHLFALIGSLITAAAAIAAFSSHSTPLSLALMFVTFIFILVPISQKFIQSYRISAGLILYQTYLLMFFLIYSGGVNNTGPLWVFLIAPLTLYICGLRVGIFNLVVFTLTLSFILFIPFDTLSVHYYPLDFKIRLIASFIAVSSFTALYEYTRESSYIELQEARDKFELLAKIDPLTQLVNRREAAQVIQYEKRRLVRNKTDLSLIICDIDNFKKINDHYGHNVGDCVLMQLATIFKASVRTQDTVARWGGEEFLFILPSTSGEQAAITAKKIHQAIKSQSCFSNSHYIDATVSMGISTLTDHSTIESAISAADKNLYKAKNAGKNRTYSDSQEILPD